MYARASANASVPASEKDGMLPTVDSRTPGKVEVNPDLSPFPNVKGSRRTQDGRLVLEVDKLPTRSRTTRDL